MCEFTILIFLFANSTFQWPAEKGTSLNKEKRHIILNSLSASQWEPVVNGLHMYTMGCSKHLVYLLCSVINSLTNFHTAVNYTCCLNRGSPMGAPRMSFETINITQQKAILLRFTALLCIENSMDVRKIDVSTLIS